MVGGLAARVPIVSKARPYLVSLSESVNTCWFVPDKLTELWFCRGINGEGSRDGELIRPYVLVSGLHPEFFIGSYLFVCQRKTRLDQSVGQFISGVMGSWTGMYIQSATSLGGFPSSPLPKNSQRWTVAQRPQPTPTHDLERNSL